MNIIHTCRPKTGSITVSKVITGLPLDETFFHIVVTGQSAEPTIVDGYVSQQETITFDNLPFDTYVITEDAHDDYTLSRIVSDTVVLSRGNRNESVVVTNELIILPVALELTFAYGAFPMLTPSDVDSWNTFIDLPTYGTPFTSVIVDEFVIKLYGATNIHLKPFLFDFSSAGGALKEIHDYALCITIIDNLTFGNFAESSPPYLEICELNAVTSTIGDPFHNSYSVKKFLFKSLLHVPYHLFQTAYFGSEIEEIDISSCTNLGGTTGDNNLFHNVDIANPLLLTIPSALMTCNSGSPDGDIQYLVTNNNVTIVTV